MIHVYLNADGCHLVGIPRQYDKRVLDHAVMMSEEASWYYESRIVEDGFFRLPDDVERGPVERWANRLSRQAESLRQDAIDLQREALEIHEKAITMTHLANQGRP